ncbi:MULTISPECIES: DMT family transporter [unclassified Acinetobacter]|uniref:DMT family transporter n=1 Tax=unclassified Acinetobacter TaxID=196816 RepID=UPI0025BDF749|nr:MULTISPECIES: DMT family transporter [unclassified Acinetobacter]
MNIKVISAIGLLCLIWGSLWGLVKHSLQIFPPFLFISVRLILAALTLMGVQLLLRRSVLPERGQWKKLFISSLLICLGFYATQTFAMQFVDSGLSAILVFTMPIFIGVLAHYFLNERLTAQKILGLILGTCGLISILWPQFHDIHFNLSLIGQVFLIVSGFFWATTTVYSKKYFATHDKMQLTIWQMLLGGIILLLGALCFEPVHFNVWLNPSHGGLLIYIAMIGTGFAFALWNWIVSQVDAVVASISIMIIPILSLFFGYVFWNEPMTFNIILGAVFICLGIILSSVKIKSEKHNLNIICKERS